MKDIRVSFSKKENDIEAKWNAGSRQTALFFLELFGKMFIDEMQSRGYDIKTMNFSINKITTQTAQNQSAQKENDHVKSNNLHINDSAQFAQEKKE